jgi:hypothetical protein
MKKTLITLIALFNFLFVFSQEIQTSKRISIPSPTKNVLLKIKASGIDLSCGPKFVNNNLEMELSYQELQSLKKNGINYNVLIPNLSKFYKDRNAVDLPKAKANLNSLKTESRKRNLANKSLSLKSTLINNPAQHDECSEINWTIPTNFQLGSMGGCLTVSETLAQLDLMRTLYPNLISVKTDASSTGQTTHGNSTGATTWPGQTIYYVRISDNPDSDEAGEPETLITGMMHAREANSLMNIMYFMWYILENYNSDPFIKNMVDNQELYFMPISNPDGVRWNEVIAPGGGGLQRKNLGPDGSNNGTTNTSNNARGIDLNRNFNYYWGWNNSGSSPSANSQTFRGTSAGSEPETQIIKDFISNHDIKVAVNHHGGLNSIVTSSYNGNVSATDSGREDEYAKICHDLTQYNRYIYGSAPNTLYEANGDVNDWMLGGTSVSSGGQTSSGSGKDVLALTPENGDDFWPAPSLFTPIAQRAMRMNFIAVMHSGKFAELHDLNNSNISTTSGNLNFGVEYLGKTYGDITLTVTPVSTNIISITSPLVQSGWSKLEQRNLNIPYVLNAAIQPNDEIEFQVTLSNDDFIIYQANYVKYYQPTLVFQDNDTDTSNWTTSGGTWGTTADAHIGSVAITDSPSGAYSNNVSKSITLSSPLNLSSYSSVLVQFYAKWELERNYDLVQLEASTDSGSNWTALCGSYNKPSATELTNFHLNKNSDAFRQHQSTNGDIVYDGDSMNKWVMEEIHINSTENNFLFNQSNVQLRFRFKSDTSNREDDLTTTFDGFIFDDFKVIGIQTQCIISVPTGLASNNVTTNNVSISWNNIPSATYDLRYREIGTTTWTNINGLTVLTTNLTGLNSSTDYEVQARSNCGVNNSAYTSSTNFTTTAVTYCTSEGNNAGATDEFISNVLIKTINNTTGNDSYSDFTSKSTDVTLGKLVTISITPTWSNIIYNEAYSVWIDYNRDGDFSDPGENVWTKSASKTTPVSGNFTIPLSATVGTTRMRVSMKYNGIPTECETFQYGEVEDYTIIIEGTGPDVTVPVITLNGASPIDINQGVTYTELGATAIDNVDGDITANIIVGGAVDVNTAGSYSITYDVSDNAGNIATQVIRTVNIIPDTTAPVITINGASTINLNLGTTYTEQGATASDDFDGDITANIIVGGVVDVNTAGSYFITYDVSDNAGNIATQVIRTVNIIEVPNGCVGGISSFPYVESFENTLGDWTQSAADDINWTIDANGTPSNNTGPSSATDGTYYLYVEASSPNFPSKRAIVNSPCFDLSALTKATFSFSYHMYGAADMGTIDLEISDDDGLTWTSIWSQSDNQGNSWLNVNVNLSTYVGGGVQLRFNRFIGSTWQADIAIDNISLIDEEFIVQSCTAEIASFPYNEGFESTLGGWSQSAADDMDWTIDANGTPSSNTGPSSAIEGTNYLYVEASTPNFPSKRAIVNSPCFDLSLQSSATFSFNYHQYGSTDMGTLNLEASVDNGNSWSSIWNSSGNLGNSWQSASVDLSAYLGDTVQLRFNRFIGGTWQADIAIDNINLTTSSAAKGSNDKLLDINNNTISNFLIYPNPVKGDILNIKLSKSINVSYKIINMLGQIVNTGKITKEIPVGNLQEGTYFIQVNDGERIYTEKFVKN